MKAFRPIYVIIVLTVLNSCGEKRNSNISLNTGLNEEESDYLKKRDEYIERPFETIFQSAFQSDVRVTNFSFVNIPSTDSVQAYSMTAGLSQINGRFTPEYVYVLVSMGNYVYLAENQLREPLKEIAKCTSVWDSIIYKQSQPVDDKL